MPKPVVLIAEELSPATVDALGPDFDIRSVDGTDRPALLAALADAHAVLIRSATKIDAEAIAAAPLLKVVARAGVGLDNVDIKAATTAGVMVVNAPTSNIISAAELTIGHILSLARHIPAAHALARPGAVEARRVHRHGALREDRRHHRPRPHRRAHRRAPAAPSACASSRYDPYVTAPRAQQLGVQLVTLDELLEQSDFVTIHMPKTPETTGMIGAEQFARMKPTAFVVNVARGGLIDEDALSRRADRRRDRRSRPRRVHERAAGDDSRPATARPAERRRHAAPRRVDRRGAGEGRRLGRQLGAARARGRARARCRQRRGRRHRPVRASRHPARREARPVLRRPGPLAAHEPRRRGARRARRLRRQRAQARGAQGHLHQHRQREASPT